MTIPPNHEVLHALGHHQWVYLIWRSKSLYRDSAWDYSLTGKVTKKTPNWPVRFCPVCGTIQENKTHDPGWKDSLCWLSQDKWIENKNWVIEITETGTDFYRRKYGLEG